MPLRFRAKLYFVWSTIRVRDVEANSEFMRMLTRKASAARNLAAHLCFSRKGGLVFKSDHRRC
jgi:hypothetical protein